MRRKHFLTIFSLALASFLLILGVQFAQPDRARTSLLISAAASLQDVLEEVKPLYQKVHPEVNLTFNFGASGALLQQIQQGAPADVFISAAQAQMDTLEQQDALVPGTRSNLASNQLVLIVPQTSSSVTRFAQLQDSAITRIAIGEPRSVPAGQYAQQVLQKLNLFNEVQPKLVYANTVRQVLAAVESGNAEAGFVYVTDTRVSDKVKVAVTVSDTLHSAIVYPMAGLKTSKNIAAAKALMHYLSGPEARAVLRKSGFIVPKP